MRILLAVRGSSAYNKAIMVDDNLSEADERRIFGELIADKLQIIMEHLEGLSSLPGRVAKLEEGQAEMGADIKIIKAAITDQGKQLNDLDARVARVEVAG